MSQWPAVRRIYPRDGLNRYNGVVGEVTCTCRAVARVSRAQMWAAASRPRANLAPDPRRFETSRLY